MEPYPGEHRGGLDVLHARRFGTVQPEGVPLLIERHGVTAPIDVVREVKIPANISREAGYAKRRNVIPQAEKPDPSLLAAARLDLLRHDLIGEA